MASLPDIEQPRELRRLLHQVFRRFGALGTDRTPCGLALPLAHAHALMVLLQRGELAQLELGRELGIDKSNVARLCARMVEAGHADQRVGDEDLRSRRVALTEHGTRVAHQVTRASEARFAAVIHALPPASRAEVLVTLGRLVAAIDSLPAPSPKKRDSP